MKTLFPPILLLVFLLFACEEETTTASIDEIMVEGYLHADRPLSSIIFSQVIPLDSTNSIPTPSNLSPFIWDELGNAYPLSYDETEGSYGNESLIIEAEKTYSLELNYQNKLITAETFIPLAPQNPSLSIDRIERKKIREFEDLLNQTPSDPIEVTWEAEPDAYYFVEVRNVEENPEIINELFEEEDGPASPFGGFQSEPSITDFYAINTFLEITHYGSHEVIIYRVNPEYVLLYEDSSDGVGGLNEIRTNVNNGFGIFTGINSEKRFFEVVRQ